MSLLSLYEKINVFSYLMFQEKKYPRLEKADILEMAVNHLYALNGKDCNIGKFI